MLEIAVTGANSSVGQNLLSHVAAQEDLRARACVRSERAAATLPSAPRIEPRISGYDDLDGLADALGGATCVVHLAGILMESKSSTYATANVGSAAAVVEAAGRAGVEHIVLVSVVGAALDSPNAYLASKAEAERVVEESGMSATVIRTPILLGPGSAGADALIRTASQDGPRLLGGGTHVLRPLDLDDLSQAILNACRAAQPGVVTYDLVGPVGISYRDLVTQTADIMGRTVSIGALPVWFAKAAAYVRGLLTTGGMTPTVIDVITMSETVPTNADAELGVTLTPLPKTLEKILTHARQDS